MRASSGAYRRRRACRLSPPRPGGRHFEAVAARRRLCAPAATTGTPDAADRPCAERSVAATRRRGDYRGRARLHVDARRAAAWSVAGHQMLAGRIWRRCRAAARVARVAAAPRRRWERGRMTVQPWSDPSGLSDLELAARIAARDRAAVRIVTERNNQRLFRVARSVLKQREEAEDRSEEHTSELQSLM